jgi:hypothetical protein
MKHLFKFSTQRHKQLLAYKHKRLQLIKDVMYNPTQQLTPISFPIDNIIPHFFINTFLCQ